MVCNGEKTRMYIFKSNSQNRHSASVRQRGRVSTVNRLDTSFRWYLAFMIFFSCRHVQLQTTYVARYCNHGLTHFAMALIINPGRAILWGGISCHLWYVDNGTL